MASNSVEEVIYVTTDIPGEINRDVKMLFMYKY